MSANDALDRMKTALSIVEKRDRPWLIAEDAWGETAAHIRREVAGRTPAGARRPSLDWEVYDLLFSKAYDQTIETARMARNPIAEVINQGLLTKLYATHAAALNQLNDVLQQADDLGAALPPFAAGSPLRTARFGPMPDTRTPREASRPKAEGTHAAECALFRDPARSSALLLHDSAAWRVLNDKCNANR